MTLKFGVEQMVKSTGISIENVNGFLITSTVLKMLTCELIIRTFGIGVLFEFLLPENLH